MRKFDFVIVGGGTAGIAAAIRANELGAKTALIEEGEIGGTSVNLGCIPTKSLLKDGESGHTDFAAAMARVTRVINAMRLHNYEWPLASLRNLTRLRGHARFAGRHELNVGDETIRAGAILLATGSVPRIPGIQGLDKIDFLTDRDFLGLTRLPRSLMIIGGGPLGLEFAQIFNNFGIEVTVIQRGSQVLAGIEPEIAARAHKYLTAAGIDIRVGELPQEVRWRGAQKELTTSSPIGERRYEAEDILVATGRVVNTARLNIEEIGIELDAKGSIAVDDELATSVPHIYAAGDVRGGPMIENAARKEGVVAAENALAGFGTQIDYEAIPSSVFIHPPVARVGMTETDAVRRHHQVESHTLDYADLPRAIVDGDMRGLIKMVTDKRTHRVLGCSVIGENAGDIIHEAALAVKFRLSVEDLAALEHVYPTYSQANSLVAEKFTARPGVNRSVRRLQERAA